MTISAIISGVSLLEPRVADVSEASVCQNQLKHLFTSGIREVKELFGCGSTGSSPMGLEK